VHNNFWRNLGDDGLAMWSEHHAGHSYIFTQNTIVLPVLANGIPIYGGSDNQVTGNVIAESLTQGRRRSNSCWKSIQCSSTCWQDAYSEQHCSSRWIPIGSLVLERFGSGPSKLL
jgi:hypothetical protein